MEAGDDPLIKETNEMMKSYHEINPSTNASADSLKNTTHLKALSTAIQLASSHHSLGAKILGEDSQGLDPFKEAVNHHLQALELVRVTRGLRAACNILALSMESGGRLSITGRPLAVVSDSF